MTRTASAALSPEKFPFRPQRMKTLFLCAVVFASPLLAAAAPVEDPDKLLATTPAMSAALEPKLGEFERSTGLKIVLRFNAKSPNAEEDKVPGAYMQALAKERGLAARGVLVGYFADENDWRVWIGDDLASKFVGQPGTAKALTENGAIHKVKEAMIEAAQAAGDKAFAELQKSAPADRPPEKADQVRLQAVALLDALTAKFRGPGGGKP